MVGYFCLLIFTMKRIIFSVSCLLHLKGGQPKNNKSNTPFWLPNKQKEKNAPCVGAALKNR